MMGVGGLAPAHNAGLGRHKLAVELVAQSARSGRDSIVLEIWEVCGGPVRICCWRCAFLATRSANCYHKCFYFRLAQLQNIRVPA
jgi:hypothetical protein